MRWNLLIAVIGLSITDVASHAQRPPDDQRLAVARSASAHAGFFASTGVVRFQLIQGRLCLDSPRHRKGCQNRNEDGVYEKITVTAQRGIPSMHYVCQTPHHHLTLSVQKADSVRIESWFPNTSERSVLEQSDLGEIAWTHSRGNLKEQYDGSTLLHVRHADPISFDLHYGLLIQRLLRGRSLQTLSKATRTAMLNQVTNASTPDAESIQRCVDQLRSKRRSIRIAAERQLLSWGTPIVPAIGRLHADNLDAEQSSRLRLILHRLRPRVDDTPSTLAKLLVNDSAYWTSISGDLSSDQLRVANHHLKRFGAEPIEMTAGPDERIATARD